MAGEVIHAVCPHCDAVNRIPATRLGEAARCGACKRPLFDGHPVALTEAQARTQIARSDLPVLVDFWATWCGPCRAMAPELEAATPRLEPAMRVAKVDVDAAPSLAGQFRIQSVPTLILFRGGREVARISGALRQRQIVDWATVRAA